MQQHFSDSEIEQYVRSLHHLPTLEKIASEELSQMERFLRSAPPKRILLKAPAEVDLGAIAQKISFDLASEFLMPSQMHEVRYQGLFEKGEERFDETTKTYIVEKKSKNMIVPTLTSLMAFNAFKEKGLTSKVFAPVRYGACMQMIKHMAKQFGKRERDDGFLSALYLENRAFHLGHPQEYINQNALYELCSVDSWIRGSPTLAEDLAKRDARFEQGYAESFDAQFLACHKRPSDAALGNAYVELIQRNGKPKFIRDIFEAPSK